MTVKVKDNAVPNISQFSTQVILYTQSSAFPQRSQQAEHCSGYIYCFPVGPK